MTATDLASASTLPPVLEAAAGGDRPAAHGVVAGLLAAERQAKQQRRSLSAAALLGTWQLRFTAPKKATYRSGQPVGKGFYMPAIAVATLAFSPDPDVADQLHIENQLRVGPLALRFSGPAKFLAKKNLLAFDFRRVQVWAGPLRVLSLPLGGRTAEFGAAPVGKLPFFAFFAAEDGYIAARGRGGGLALWARANPS